MTYLSEVMQTHRVKGEDMAEVFHPGDRVKVEGRVLQQRDGVVTIHVTKDDFRTGDGLLHVAHQKVTLVERAEIPEPAYKYAVVTTSAEDGNRVDVWRRVRNQWDDPEGPTSAPWKNLTGTPTRWSWREIVTLARDNDLVIKHLMPEQIFPAEA